MRRRDLLSLALAVTLISRAHALAPKPRLATLSPSSQTASAARWGAFWEGMQALGHSRDDFVVENRWADGHPDQLSGLAAELVRLNPQIIVCYGSEATLAAKQATTSIPVVMAISADPIGAGLAASLARPGGNVTGLSMQQPDMAGKHVELLKRVVPQAKRKHDDQRHVGCSELVSKRLRRLGRLCINMDDVVDGRFGRGAGHYTCYLAVDHELHAVFCAAGVDAILCSFRHRHRGGSDCLQSADRANGEQSPISLFGRLAAHVGCTAPQPA